MLNYEIQVGHSIDVGKLIFSSLMHIIRRSTSVDLGHPSLVYSLCVSIGVLAILLLERDREEEEEMMDIIPDRPGPHVFLNLAKRPSPSNSIKGWHIFSRISAVKALQYIKLLA
ncbi:hypothetical protein IEQ34_008382 [Dendrobium chrysotoxum]|uniref:Uncharacterized protein n=1 Tax=Dendrobium chrysotoxum TaxID=161865 RepID=A0AAV7GXV1_DENCH|nr:hypothetical protein IEQ34_008382 [Dendrobium chrysotoxum]